MAELKSNRNGAGLDRIDTVNRVKLRTFARFPTGKNET